MSNLINNLIDFWFNNENIDSEDYKEILKDAENGIYLEWLNSHKGFLAHIILLYCISKMVNNETKQHFINLQKIQMFIHMGLNIYGLTEFSVEEIDLIFTPFHYLEDKDEYKELIDTLKKQNTNNKLDDIIDEHEATYNVLLKFGRLPHLNEIQRRESTEDEIDFLDEFF